MAKATKIKIPFVIAIAIVLIAAAAVLALVFVNGEKEEKEKAGPEEPIIADEIYGFSAEIKEIKGKTLVLEGWVPLANPEAEPLKTTLTAVVTNETEISKLKFPKETVGEDGKPIQPKRTAMSFSELKVGDKIEIGTTGDIADDLRESIVNQTEFTLKFLFIIER